MLGASSTLASSTLVGVDTELSAPESPISLAVPRAVVGAARASWIPTQPADADVLGSITLTLTLTRSLMHPHTARLGLGLSPSLNLPRP